MIDKRESRKITWISFMNVSNLTPTTSLQLLKGPKASARDCCGWYYAARLLWGLCKCVTVWVGVGSRIIMRKVDACLEWPPHVKARSAMTTGTKGRKHPENQDGIRVVNYPIIAECIELLFLLPNIFGRIVSWHHIDEGQSGSFFFLRGRKLNHACLYFLFSVNIRRWVFFPEYCLEKLFFWSFSCSILFLHCILSCCVSS